MFTGTTGIDNRRRVQRELQTMQAVLAQYISACERFDDKAGKEVLRDVIGCMRQAENAIKQIEIAEEDITKVDEWLDIVCGLI